MSLETPKWEPTQEQIIESKFDQETVNEIKKISNTIFEQMKAGVVNIGMKEESSQTQQEQVEQYLEMWRSFSINLFARTSSENAKSPEVVDIAINGASSLLSTELLRGNESADMIDALKKRYE